VKAELTNFEEFQNKPNTWSGGDPWETDFRTIPPRRYKTYQGYFRVYEHGMVEIRRRPHGQIGAESERQHQSHQFGFRWRLLQETSAQFFLPDRTPIAKSWIANTSCMLFDSNHGMALTCSWQQGSEIHYYSAGARPTGGSEIHVDMYDPAEVRKLRNTIAPMVALATSYRAVSDQRRNHEWAKEWLRKVREGEPVTLDTPPDPLFLQSLASALDDLNFYTRQACTEEKVVPFLYFKE
jgi:hypothetical protein